MDATPPAPQEFFDRLQQELDAAEEGSPCKLELKFDPAGAGVNVPTLNPLRRDEPVYEQLIEHLRREGCSPGKYRIRMRIAGVMGPQKVEPVQFAPAVTPQVAPQVAPQVTGRGPAVAPAVEPNPFSSAAKTFKAFREAQEQLAQMFPEPEPQEDGDEEEEYEDDGVPDEEAPQPPDWLDEAKKDAAKEIVPLAVSLGGALVDLMKAFAKKLGGDLGAATTTLSGAEVPRPRPAPAAAAGPTVELLRDDDERAAS